MNKKLIFVLIFTMFLVGISCVSAEELYGGEKNEYKKILVIAHNFNNTNKYNLY